MNRKAMAVLAAVMMVGIAFGAISVQTDAATAKDLGEVVVSDTVTQKKVAFTTNEGEFKGYKYTVKFYAVEWDGSADVAGLTYGTEVGMTTVSAVGGDPAYAAGTSKSIPGTSSTFNVSVEYGNKVGTYLMAVERTNQITEQKIALKAEITVDLNLTPNPVYNTYYSATVKDGSVSTMTIDAMADIKGGEFYSKQVSATGLTVTDFKWYAYNLPAGLSMSESGWVSGIYVGNAAVTEQEAKIIAVSNAATYQGTMKVSCTAYAAPEDLTITIKDAAAGTPEIAKDSSVVRVVDGEMKFTVEVKRGATPVTTGVTVNVVAVDSTGSVAKLADSGGTYTAPTNGTGAYRIVVTASDGLKEATSSFYLYVLPAYGNVEAQIIPGST